MTITGIFFSDTHCNSTVGLCAPGCYLDDGQLISLSKGQRWLWDCWIDLVERAKEIKKRNAVVAFANGDLGEVDRKARSYQLFSGNKQTIKNISCASLEPLMSVVDAAYFIRGTSAHVGKSAYIEELIAADFENAIPFDRKKKIYSHWSILMDCERVGIDIAHHTTNGMVPWTAPNAANRLAAQSLFYSAENGLRIPDLVIRSHVHHWGDSYDAFKTRAIILPAWTLATEYVHQIKPDALAEIGACLIYFDGGKYEVEKIKYKPEGKIWIKPQLLKTNCSPSSPKKSTEAK